MTSEYSRYRWKWNNYPLLYIVNRVPIHLDIELTTRCNYKCGMCPRTNNNIPIIDMPLKIVKRIIREFAEKKGSSIKFCYLGESLLYPHLFEVIKYAKKKGIIETMIATNASLLTKNIAENLIKSGLDWIIFSVDSCKSEIYEKIRINGNLKIVVKNIKNFHRIRKKLNLGSPKIWIQAIKQELNKQEIENMEFFNFWIPYTDQIKYNELRDYNLTESIGEKPNFFCKGVYRRMTVRVDGDISICCGERNDNKIIGNIFNITIEEAWLNYKFKIIRELMKSRESHLIEVCKTCPGRLN